MSDNSPSAKPLSKLTEAEIKELSKPLIFGNYQRQFKVFSWAVGAGLLYYMMFRHDFGEKRHCFSWIRELKDKTMKEFFRIDPDDKELQRIKQKHKQNNNNTNNQHKLQALTEQQR